MTKVLAKLYWQMAVNSFKHAPSKTKTVYLISGIIFGIFVLFFSAIVASSARTLPDDYLSLILSYAFATVIGLVIIIGVPQVFNDLFSSKELDHLFTLPIPTRNIFWIKYCQSFIAVPGFISVFSIVLLTVYGLFSKASLLFYPVSYLVIIAITIIGMSIAYLLNLILVQIIPAHRAKEFTTAMGAFAGILTYISFQLPSYFISETEADDFVVSLPTLPKWLPLTWAGDAIAEAKLASFSFVVPFLLLIILALSLIVLATFIVERSFRKGWVKVNERATKKKKAKWGKVNSKLYHPVIFIGLKEWLSIKRDAREWLVFLPVLFFMFFPLISLFNERELLNELLSEPLLTWTILLSAFFFMYGLFGSTFSATTIGREGESLYLLNVLPVNSWHVALGKFWISIAVPVGLLSLLQIGLGLLLNWSFIQIVTAIFLLIIYSCGINGIGLAFGTIGSRFNRDNPQQRLKFGASLVLMIVTFIYMSISVLPLSLTYFPIEIFVADEGFDATSSDLPSFLAIIINWRLTNSLLIKTIGVSLFSFISFSTAAFTLYLTKLKIDKGLDIEIVSKTKVVKPLK